MRQRVLIQSINDELNKEETQSPAILCQLALAEQQERTADALEEIARTLKEMHTKTDTFNVEVRGNITNQH